MKLADRERGAQVRRNLRRWWKPLLTMMIGWGLLVPMISTGAIIYARTHNLSQRRTQTLAEGCGVIMVVVLIVAWLTVLVMANRKKTEQEDRRREPT